MLLIETTVFLNFEWSCSVTESHWLLDSADPVLGVTEFLGCPVRADAPAHSHAFTPSDRKSSSIISFLLQELVLPHQICGVKEAGRLCSLLIVSSSKDRSTQSHSQPHIRTVNKENLKSRRLSFLPIIWRISGHSLCTSSADFSLAHRGT